MNDADQPGSGRFVADTVCGLRSKTPLPNADSLAQLIASCAQLNIAAPPAFG